MSDNKYRDYLTNDEAFHRQYLKNEDEPVGSSSFTKFIMGSMAVVGLFAGSAAAYRSGAFRGAAEAMIDKLGDFRRSGLQNTLDSIRNWTKDDGWDEMKGKSLTDKFLRAGEQFAKAQDYIIKGQIAHESRMSQLQRSPIIQDKSFELIDYIEQQEAVMRKERKRVESLREAGDLDEISSIQKRESAYEDFLDDILEKVNRTTKDQQEAMRKRTGYELATVEDVYNEIPLAQREILDQVEKRLNDKGRTLKDRVIDHNILVKKGDDGSINRFADMRDWREAVAEAGDTIAEDFTIPFIRINPFRMFYLNEFTKNNRATRFASLNSTDYQPFVSHNTGRLGEDMLFADGGLYKFNESSGKVEEMVDMNKGYLVSARESGQGSLLARQTRNMMNLYKDRRVEYSEVSPKRYDRRLWGWITDKLDIGRQNEYSHREMEIGDPITFVNRMSERLFEGIGSWKGLKPYSSIEPGEAAFGKDAEFLFIPRYRNIKESASTSDYFKQWWGARKNPQDVSTVSFIAYTAAERLNATIGQMKLGLSAQNLGSAPQILGQLILRRAAPVVAGVGLVRYGNYEWENMTGDELEDQVANAYANSQMDLASLRDKTGMTDFFKDMGNIMPGFEFISELPIPVITTEGMTPVPLKDILPLNKSAEELREYYLNGEEAVRKGRYWEFGNTPLTGGKVDYYAPNWFRRITSDWQYTDTLWGSKEEFWENNWMPTFRHPFAPIKHFITDPYHWEKKHYEDRPYMLTGGIPEIENFPLIGPLLNATVGQVLKPQLQMHYEEWHNPGAYKETLGFQMAETLGILGGEGGGSAVMGSPGGLFGIGNTMQTSGSRTGYSGGYNPTEPIAYVTSSGSVQVLAKEMQTNMDTLNYMIRGSGIASTGVTEQLYLEPYEFGSPAESVANPASINMTMNDMFYNTTEMGGFYGWVTGMAAGISENQYEPRIQTSSKAYGYERAFWDQDLGNMGSDGMEIFRRFIPRDAHKNYVNELDNNMPTWVPGSDYFTNFQTGDPYVKVKRGEMRLPGESYERLYGIDQDIMDLDIGASTIGYGIDKMIDKWLQRDAIMSDQQQFVMSRGTEWHKAWEADMAEKNIAISMEQYVKDEASGIGGFYDVYAHHDRAMAWMLENAVEFNYYASTPGGSGAEEYEGFYAAPVDIMQLDDASKQEMLRSLLSASSKVLMDPKTRSDKRFEEKMQFENTQQVNFYASQMGTRINYIVHADPDNPEKGLKIQAFEYSPELLNYTKSKVEVARATVRQMLDDGAIGRGDLYSMVDRYRILADVAPYSEEFRKLRSQLSKIDLSPTEKEEIQTINDQVSARKDSVRTYDYRFKTANLDSEYVTIKKVLDNNTFLTEEYPDNPIRLAGVYVPSGQDEAGQEASKFVGKYLTEGANIQISINADEANRVNNDTYKTISAVVRTGNIRNLNRELIERGLAKEKEEDWSPTGVHARFSEGQIAFGSAWETFAHLDTPFHTVFMQARSPLEQYERREVYGKNWQDWADPIEDYMIPWYQNWISKAPVAAVGLGTMMGYFFGGESRYGKIMGALIGGASSLLGVSYVKGMELATGERWIPERREREREVEEYIDTLKYVKYRALFEEAADVALQEDGIDVRGYLGRKARDGDYRSRRLYELEQIKRDLVTGQNNAARRAVDLVGVHDTREELMKAINQEINSIRNDREADRLTPLAAQAIQYYNEAEKTMYAYDPGDPIANILSALPKKDRGYLTKFLAAPEEERDDILDVAPRYMRRVLQASWGMEVDEKQDLETYFTRHQLPNQDWAGWDPRANLDDIKIKIVKREGLDESEFNIWHEDEQRAARIQEDVVPEINFSDRIGTVRNKLRDILGVAGVKNLEVEIQETEAQGVHMDLDIKRDRRDEIKQQMNSNGYSLI